MATNSASFPTMEHAPQKVSWAAAPPIFPETVPVAAPAVPVTDALLAEIRVLLEQSQLTNGETVRRFEEQAARYLGVAECVAVSSCTSGLMLVERLLGLSGEVIVPSFTFFATGHSLLWNDLEPVLVDCDPVTFNIDPQCVEDAISPRTSAVLGVHVFGCPAPVKELEEICRRHSLRLIFDGAHAFGSYLEGRPVACWGDATVYSLTPTKPLVAGEGGLIATDDPELAARLRQGRNYGKGENYDCPVLGLNARMTEIQAAIALAGLPHAEEGIERRNALATIYEDCLSQVDGIRLQALGPLMRSSRKDFAMLVDPAQFGSTRDQVAAVLARDNVETRCYFDPPLHRQRLYQSFRAFPNGVLPVTEQISANVLCLPMFAGLPNRTAELIANRIGAMAGRPAATVEVGSLT